MNIVVCDDSQKDREILIKLLREYERHYNQHFVITEYNSGMELCKNETILQNCHIVFLDIVMSEMNGLKTAVEIKKNYPKIIIVLVSADVNYALDGYKVKASRFLLKGDLPQTIHECMNDLIVEINQNRQELEFPFVEGNRNLRIEDISHIETSKHKCFFHTTDGIFSIYRKLSDIEMELKDLGFLRIHQSFLVNMKYIKKINSYVLELKSGNEFSVPRSRYKEVKKQYALYREQS